jgi:hypothetical protein
MGLQGQLLNSIFLCLLLFMGCNQSPVPIGYNRIINGLEEGEWRKYHDNGVLKEKRFYSHGVKVGVLKTWWDNGQLQVLYRFKNGEYNGTCFEWNRNGVLIKKMNYEAGIEVGQQRQWYDDGSVRSNYVMKNGRRFGLLGTKNCINVKDSLDHF